MSTIWAHTLVKNEERYLWFAVESVIDCVDRLLLWDTGSTDKTRDIIRILKKKYKDKIETKFFKEVTPKEYTDLRQKMLDATKSDWFIIVDGDEVWWEGGINKLTDLIRENGSKYESIVNGYYNVVGDIFHYLNESSGRYKIDDLTGHITIRAINRNIRGLYTAKPHGQHGYYDENDVLVQDRHSDKRIHLNEKTYLHFTNVIRSSSQYSDSLVPKRKKKHKFELGIPFPKDFYLPEVFFRDRPAIVPSPWLKMDRSYFLRALFETPLRKIKRRLFKGKVGY